jgi:hypothetical protein
MCDELDNDFGSSSGMEIDQTNEKKANNKPDVQNANVLDSDSED